MTDVSGHSGLVAGRWHDLTLVEQLGNIGSEVGRALRAKTQQNQQRLDASLGRTLELFDLTIADPRLVHRLKEIVRAREVVADFLAGDNQYGSTPSSLEAYFMPFALAARRAR